MAASRSPFRLDYNVLERELGQRGFFARLYDLKINGDVTRVLPRDVQLDPVTDAPIHIDFIRYVAGRDARGFD